MHTGDFQRRLSLLSTLVQSLHSATHIWLAAALLSLSGAGTVYSILGLVVFYVSMTRQIKTIRDQSAVDQQPISQITWLSPPYNNCLSWIRA
jgi:hypothetical protein